MHSAKVEISYSREKLTLANELLYEIKVSEAMSRDVISFTPGATFREIQIALKENKISGVPILDGRGKLIGIVSIDDVFTAFDRGYIDENIASRMTKRVLTVPRNYSVVSAIRILEKSGVGRLPVTENAAGGRVVGIITIGDILKRLLVVVNLVAESVQNAESEALRRESDTLLPGLREQKFRFEVKRDDFDNAGKIASIIKVNLNKAGIDRQVVRRVAIICYEAEMNIIIHSLGGVITVLISPEQVAITAEDVGPGIPDVEQALRPGYTTASEKIRALGFGAGMGLANIKNCSDRMDLASSLETGTRLEAVVELGKKDEAQ